MPDGDESSPPVQAGALQQVRRDHDPREAESLATLLGAAFARTVSGWAKQQKVSLAEAAAELARTPAADVCEMPPRSVSGWGLARLAEHDPAGAAVVWENVKVAARDELDTGHRVADAVDYDGDVWQRAQFLALRTAFREDWQPRGGTEAALIDAMAVSFTAYLVWTTRATMTSYHDAKRQDASVKAYGYYEPPRLTEAGGYRADGGDGGSLAQDVPAKRAGAAGFTSPRANRGINVQSVGQLNVGAQQVNVQAEQGEQ